MYPSFACLPPYGFPSVLHLCSIGSVCWFSFFVYIFIYTNSSNFYPNLLPESSPISAIRYRARHLRWDSFFKIEVNGVRIGGEILLLKIIQMKIIQMRLSHIVLLISRSVLRDLFNPCVYQLLSLFFYIDIPIAIAPLPSKVVPIPCSTLRSDRR